MKLEIESDAGGLNTFHLIGTPTIQAGQVVDIGGGLTATYEGSMVRRAVGIPEIIMFGLSIPAGVISSVTASLMWDWLRKASKPPPRRISIDRITVEFEEAAVKRVIVERIEHLQDRKG